MIFHLKLDFFLTNDESIMNF